MTDWILVWLLVLMIAGAGGVYIVLAVLACFLLFVIYKMWRLGAFERPPSPLTYAEKVDRGLLERPVNSSTSTADRSCLGTAHCSRPDSAV